jgi:hypothetical protein
MHHRVTGDALCELFQFLLGRQLAVQQQIAHFDEIGSIGQIVDRITAIQQFALVAVDISDGRVTGGRGSETRIVGEHARLCVEFSNVDDIGTYRR